MLKGAAERERERLAKQVGGEGRRWAPACDASVSEGVRAGWPRWIPSPFPARVCPLRACVPAPGDQHASCEWVCVLVGVRAIRCARPAAGGAPRRPAAPRPATGPAPARARSQVESTCARQRCVGLLQSSTAPWPVRGKGELGVACAQGVLRPGPLTRPFMFRASASAGGCVALPCWRSWFLSPSLRQVKSPRAQSSALQRWSTQVSVCARRAVNASPTCATSRAHARRAFETRT
jgi:hypothetical protein